MKSKPTDKRNMDYLKAIAAFNVPIDTLVLVIIKQELILAKLDGIIETTKEIKDIFNRKDNND